MAIFIITALVIILILIIFPTVYLFNLVLFPKKRNYDETYTREKNLGKLDDLLFETPNKEELFIKSNYGYDLHALFYPIKGSNKTIIICHGITHTLHGAAKYMDLYIKRGFNILIYDHRFHGKSGGTNCSYGYYEKYDLKTVSDWVFSRCGESSIVGIMGESMGAATALQNSAIDDRISFYIADCSYSDLIALFKIRIKEDYHLPAFPLIPIASLLNKFNAGIYYNEVSPINAIKDVSTPIFFIHGENDTYIPHQMSIDMFNIKKGVKKLYIAPNADHVEAYIKNKEEYDKLIEEFLQSLGM